MMVDQLNYLLKNFCSMTPDVLGCAVIDIDGVISASVLGQKVDEDLVGGMSSTMLGVGERISAELMNSELEQVYVRSPNGYVMLNAIDDHALFLVMATNTAKLGLVFMEMKRAVKDLKLAV